MILASELIARARGTSQLVAAIGTVRLTVALPCGWYAILAHGRVRGGAREMIVSTDRCRATSSTIVGQNQRFRTRATGQRYSSFVGNGAGADTEMRAATIIVERAAHMCLHERVLGHIDRDEVREHATCRHMRASSINPIERLVDSLNHLSGFTSDKYGFSCYLNLKFYYTKSWKSADVNNPRFRGSNETLSLTCASRSYQ